MWHCQAKQQADTKENTRKQPKPKMKAAHADEESWLAVCNSLLQMHNITLIESLQAATGVCDAARI